MDKVWISIAIATAILAVVESLKGFFEAPWCAWVLNKVKLGFLVPYIPVILNVLLSVAAGLTLYMADGLTGMEIWQIVLMVIGINRMADGGFKLVKKASGK